MKLAFVFLLTLCIVFTGCRNTSSYSSDSGSSSSSSSSPSSSSSDRGKLTTEKAEAALAKFGSDGSIGRAKIRGGVQEIPAQNAAKADFNIEPFENQFGKYTGGSGTAVFSRYTDGRWALTQVVNVRLNYSNGNYRSPSWNTTIDIPQ